MIDIDSIKSDYEIEKPKYESIIREAEFILDAALREANIKIHSITHRMKTLHSLIKKCEDKEVASPFHYITDIAGIRIVCLFRSDLKSIEDIIKQSFNLISIDNKIDKADGFGYMSVHYICRIRDDYNGPRYDFIKGIVIEIQTRTLCMDAWAAVSHHLSYKGNWDAPDDLKRAMNALSGLFYVADNEFLQVYNESLKSKAAASIQISNLPKAEIPINFDTVVAYMKDRLPERQEANDDAISEVVQQLIECGYKTIDDVNYDFENAYPLFIPYEEDALKARQISRKFSQLGALRVTLAIACQKIEFLRSSSSSDPSDSSEGDYTPLMIPYREKYLSKYSDRSM